MPNKPKCKRCGKIISGIIKIITYRKKVGNKTINVVETYDEDCFKEKNKEKSINGHRNKKRNCETQDC
jgi:hypothetical protein